MEYHYNWNVDAGTFSVFVALNISDVITVYADVPPVTPGPGVQPNPINWTLGQVPANGVGHESMIQTASDIYVGTMTFKAIEPGTGYISYLVTSGDLVGKSNNINLRVFGTGSVFDVNSDGTTTMH
jgi:hypothetical protein